MATAPAARASGIVAEVAGLLAEVLSLAPETAATLAAETPLFGHLPELDSMAVAPVLAALEERFGIRIDDEDVSGEIFASVGALAAFVEAKRR